MTPPKPAAWSLSLLLLPVALAAGFDWGLPPGFPAPYVPAANPMSAARAALGQHLFYDRRLSGNGTQSCASCHRQELAFTDGRARAEGSTGALHPRSSMSLANVAYAPSLTWANPSLTELEEQALVPMFGTDPVELGLAGRERPLLAALAAEPRYAPLFAAAFPGDPAPFTVANITRALAAFERTLISTRSPYDRYRYGGDPAALSPAARRGELLFFSSERGGCFQCHGGWTFSGAARTAQGPTPTPSFENTGLYAAYRAPNNGLEAHTRLAEDNGKFRAPTLRNIAVTAPYMHDGSVPTLAAVLDHYAAGGRAPGPHKSPIVTGFRLSAAGKADLLAFLDSLTDPEFLRDPRFSDPW